MLVLATAVAGCGLWPFTSRKPAEGEDSAAPRRILRIGTSGDYPPFSVTDPAGGLAGFDVEVARAFADAEGSRLELVRFRWPQLAGRLAEGAFAVAMSGITVRPERLLEGEMTAAVAVSRALLVAPAVEPPPRQKRRGQAEPPPPGPVQSSVSLAAAGQPGTRIGVNAGGHLERLGRSRFPAADWKTVGDNRDLAGLLRSRAVRALVTDDLELPVIEAALGQRLAVVAELSRDRKAYWTAPGRSTLRGSLDGWLRQRESDGSLAYLREHLLGPDAGHTGPASAGPAGQGRPDEAGGADGSGLSIASPAVRVADLAGRRLMLMPLVAAAKRAAGLPIRDVKREGAVLSLARERAEEAGLEPESSVELANAQIEAACRVQESSVATPSAAASPEPPTLETLRAAIDRIDARLTEELARSAPLQVSEPQLVGALREMAVVPVPAAQLQDLARALLGVRRVS